MASPTVQEKERSSSLNKKKGVKYESKQERDKKQQEQKMTPIERLERDYNRDKGFRVLLPWYIKYPFILLIMFILIVIVNIVLGLFHMEIWILWWHKNNGNKYKRVFSMALLSEYSYFSLGYEIIKGFYSKYAQIPSKGVAEFITNLVFTYGKLSPEDDFGFLEPFNLCETIAVGILADGDKPPSQDGMAYDKTTTWPSNEYTWRQLLKYWGASDSIDERPDDDKWKNIKSNFLYTQYHIFPDSPFIWAFTSNTAEGPNNEKTWYNSQFTQAVGINKQTSSEDLFFNGGWWGMCCFGFGTEQDLTLATIYQTLYSTVIPIESPKSTCNGANWGGAVGGAAAVGITSGIGIGAMTGFTVASGGLALLPIFAALAAAGGSLIPQMVKCL